jgi:hypothetical protein
LQEVLVISGQKTQLLEEWKILLFVILVCILSRSLIKVISFFWDVGFFNNLIFNIYYLGDGIFDRLDNEKIFYKIWEYKKKGQVHNDIRELCGKITDGIIKYSMQKKTVDNVSIIFIAFKNFENKIKDPDFEYQAFPNATIIKEKYDFSLKAK